MKYSKVKLIAILLFCISLKGIYAQNALNVLEKSDVQTSYTFDSVRKLTFNSGIMAVNTTNGNSSTYILSEIRCLNFNGQTTDISRMNSMGSTKISCYPNPAIEELQIRFESIKEGNVYLKILNIQGKVFHKQSFPIQKGTNHTTIPIGRFSGGMYICYLQIDNKIESFKFFKKEN